MKYILVWSYDNYVPAHIALGRLEEEGFDCWLKDENTVTLDPILSNAVGGIKLMVAEHQAKQAYDLLVQLRNDYKEKTSCPYCNSHDLELVSSPRKPLNWFSALGTFLLGDYALSVDKVYHCFNCNREFPEDQAIKAPGVDN